MPRPMPLIRRIARLLAWALLATTAHAQAVFRSVMPNGKIVYGNKPEPGAKESKQVNLAPLNISAPTPGSPGSAGSAEPSPAAGNNIPDVPTAERNLEAAKKALEAGREQQEGDRTGVAKGGGASSRLTDAYVQRVKGLEDAVAAAQTQLEAAQRAASR